MKKTYETPEMEITMLKDSDVIRTSTELPWDELDATGSDTTGSFSGY